MTKKQIEDSLRRQLKVQGKNAAVYQDMVNDYMYYWSLAKKLRTDIKKNGLRYKTVNGNGIEVEKANESILNLSKVTASMLKILSDLKLKEPEPEQKDPADGYLD